MEINKLNYLSHTYHGPPGKAFIVCCEDQSKCRTAVEKKTQIRCGKPSHGSHEADEVAKKCYYDHWNDKRCQHARQPQSHYRKNPHRRRVSYRKKIPFFQIAQEIL